jgi:hypothetical protein
VSEGCKACGKPLDRAAKQVKYCSKACSAKGRKMTSWRKTATKVCWVCSHEFRPLPDIRWGAWLRKDICDRFCGAAASQGRLVVVADPLAQTTPHQRLKWLRLSSSSCGKKTPWSLEMMGEFCTLSARTIWNIECGGDAKGEWIPAAAKRLGVPASLFTVPVERFARVVTEAGLTAKLSVPKEERRAA